MNIAILGAGRVGSTLGRRWAERGHAIAYGVKDPRDPRLTSLLAQSGRSATVGNSREAVARSEVVLIALPWQAVAGVIEEVGSWAGKVILDATNPIQLGDEGHSAGLLVGLTTSAAEQIAAWAPQARVAKAFNTTGWENMQDPVYGSEQLTLLVASDDAGARETAFRLARDLGFEPFDAGPLQNARYLEPMAMLWIDLCFRRGRGPGFGYRIVQR